MAVKRDPWTCTICKKDYAKPNRTRREVLNAWWEHMKEEHPRLYKEKKEAAVRKMLRTKRAKK